MKKASIWKDQPDEHDYPAAADFLGLLFPEKAAKDLAARLRRAPAQTKKVKDLLRASGLPLLPIDNPHVASDLKKIRKGKALSPVLLVRGVGSKGFPLIIADGYHRVCASWYKGEDIPIVCRIVDRPG